jgi:hypothetical protein
MSQGGLAKNISDERIGTLFNREGRYVTTVNGLPTIDVSDSSSYIRLSGGHDGFVYLDYYGSGGEVTYIYEIRTGRWWADQFNGVKALIHADDEGGEKVHGTLIGTDNGKLYVMGLGEGSDPGGTVLWEWETGSYDFGDQEYEKLIGDITVDLNTAGAAATVKLWHNAHEGVAPVPLVTTTIGSLANARDHQRIEINTGYGHLCRSLSLFFSLPNGAVDPIAVYQWHLSFIPYPAVTGRRGTDFHDYGYPGRKHVRAVVIEADTSNIARTIRVVKDGRAIGASLSVQHNGRTELEYGINPPFESYLLQLLPDDVNEWGLFNHHFVFDPYENISTKPTPWMLGEDPRAKFVQGFLLVADSDGLDATFEVQSDGGVVQEPFTFNSTGAIPYKGKLAKAYSFDVPFITHHVRIVPTGGSKLAIWDKEMKWVWEPEPELADHWETQQTDLDMNGYKHLRALYLPLMSYDVATLQFRIDGVLSASSVTVPSTGGLRKKTYVVLPALKGKVFEFLLTSPAEMRVYHREVEVLAKLWGSPEKYTSVRPFGDIHRSHGGALI